MTLLVVGDDSFDIVCLDVVVVPAFIPTTGGVTVVSEVGIEFVVDVLSSTLSVPVVSSVVMDKLECSIEIGFVEESFVTVSILIAVVFFIKITVVYYYLVM